MLSWAFKKGIQGATGQTDASGADEDTTQIEAPDTPAPIFAARAFKNAIFGARNASEATQFTAQKHSQPSKKKVTSTTPNDLSSPSKQSPSKQPTSILLTPGTGTARRKRVSFNHDVKAGNNVDSSPLASARQRKRTTLQRALENSRSAKSKKDVEKPEEKGPLKAADDESEGEWEDDICVQDTTQDMTVDLNEPQSESGKYWKAEFNRYRNEAMADIQTMVKYKALAKSYAKKKDAEALELAQKLKEEQLKVAKLEERISGMTAQNSGRRRRGSDNEDRDTLLKDLEKQTSLAAHYRDQVKELNALLKEYQGESRSSRSERRRVDTSPRTEQTLLEVNRELRRARSELKEMDKLRKEVDRLQTKLNATEEYERLTKASRHDVHMDMKRANEKVQQKDAELRKLRKDYDTLKNDAKSRTAEAMQVLQEKNDKIAELEKTIKALEIAHPSIKATRELKSSIDALGKPSKFEDAKPLRMRRSASVEDLTLDMTQKSLLGNKEEQNVENNLEKSTSETFLDWSASFKGMKNQLKKAKEEQIEANRREMESTMKDIDFDPQRSYNKEKPQEWERQKALKKKEKGSTLSHDTGRVMSQILSSELNKSPRTHGKELLQQKIQEERERRATARENIGAEMHGSLDKPASRRERPRSYAGRPLSSGSEAPGFDLVQDRFARLGGPEPERSSSMNTSRCTLPADRQAAARARLEQKKLERQRNGGGRSRDKENVRM
ncbi:spindle pole body formation-associated protein-domain-containing protein [Hypoxylon sp. FL0890]|nr:spindle pole body formation-associated protein-domain-containing protein [Hypoxylon sp. FL0890]